MDTDENFKSIKIPALCCFLVHLNCHALDTIKGMEGGLVKKTFEHPEGTGNFEKELCFYSSLGFVFCFITSTLIMEKIKQRKNL